MGWSGTYWRLGSYPGIPWGSGGSATVCRRLCYAFTMMNAADAIATLRRYESALRARGIRHAAVFGSVARGDNRPDSDLDILVEFEPEAEGSIYEYMRLKEYIAGLFDGPVDVIDRDALKPHLLAPSARDAVYAF
jgi:predicted nucleotidyltransferase